MSDIGRQMIYDFTYIQNLTNKISEQAEQKGLEQNIQIVEKQGPTTKIPLPSKVIIQHEGQIQSFPDKKNLKEFITTRPVLQEMLKALEEEKEQRSKI